MSISKLRKEISALLQKADTTARKFSNSESAVTAKRIERGLLSVKSVNNFPIVSVAVHEWVYGNPTTLNNISSIKGTKVFDNAISEGANFSVVVELSPVGFIIPRVLNIQSFDKLSDSLSACVSTLAFRVCNFSGMDLKEFTYLDQLTTYVGSSQKSNTFLLLLFFKVDEG